MPDPDIEREPCVETEPSDEIALEMKQRERLMQCFSALGWHDDREAVIAFCEALEKAQHV